MLPRRVCYLLVSFERGIEVSDDSTFYVLLKLERSQGSFRFDIDELNTVLEGKPLFTPKLASIYFLRLVLTD